MLCLDLPINNHNPMDSLDLLARSPMLYLDFLIINHNTMNNLDLPEQFHVIFGFLDNTHQFHPLSIFASIISHVIFEFCDR